MAVFLPPLFHPAAGPGVSSISPVSPTPVPAGTTVPGAAGTASSLGELATKDDVVAFIRSHTVAGATPAPTPAPGYTAVAISGSARRFSFDVDTSTFTPDEYLVTATAVREVVTGTALFSVLPAGSARPVPVTPVPVASPVAAPVPANGTYYISIDPIGNKVVGDRFSITGTTNLPPDADILVEVYSSSFKPTQKSQSGEYSGATGTVRATAPSGAQPIPAPTAGSWAGTVLPTLPSGAQPTAVPATIGAAVTRAYSTTNVQVAGVDEADIIKTDGENIYVVTGSCMHILKAYPAAEAGFLSSLSFAGSPVALYAGGGRAVVIATDTWTRPITACTPGRCGDTASATPRTLIYVFSVGDPVHPQLVREVDVDGSYSSSRMIGTRLYFVTGTPVPDNPGDLELPTVHDDHGGISTPPVYGFNTTDRTFAFSTVGSLDVAGTSPVPAQSFLLGTAGTVYASPSRLYVAVPVADADGRARTTSVYAFAIDNGEISYAGGNSVDGTLLSQYSLDEYDGNLRVATTITTNSWLLNGGSYSKVTVLDSSLAVLGVLPDIAPGERISAARFMGDRLYLVTYRHTDPFYVIGLADPRRPVILGRLRLPGVSDYLHPYDADHIIGVGQDYVSGPLKIDLFNVSDVNNPVQLAEETLGGPGSTSPVLADPKAFLFDREKNLLVLPVELHGEYSCAPGGSCTPPTIWGGAYVYGVSPETGFALRGTVEHYASSYEVDGAQVKRALYIEDTLYTMSDAKIVMSDLRGPIVQVNELDFG